MDLIPPADRVIVRQLPPESRTAFGLELPETAQQDSLRAVVLAVGEGKRYPASETPNMMYPLGEHPSLQEDYDDNGAFAGDAWYLVGLEPGDEVILPRHSGGTEITLEGGETVISILASDLLAVVAAGERS